ncbi:MFS family permease [Bifidobacterium commune]|uniref:Predicted arabinose efflux permease, MFS family n=1 Tax=Bifidobacterium commune TaxID=1505727 RepID=A0A1C4H5X5_9BIFI|nr:MFS transporter [Bifidobacterium commune]MBB2955404.1 MFS family permease [Bifidobacterium commune]SCC80151.1 Predicted arabinose efflux permease, MFS family [Bifidobacterium commune]
MNQQQNSQMVEGQGSVASAAAPGASNVSRSGEKPPWNALWVLALGLAMIVLDGSIVNVSIPAMIREIGLNLTDAQWVTSLYNIILAALLLPFGKLGDLKGRKMTLQVGVVIFVAGSVLAASSNGAGMLLSARAIQAVGGALVMPSTLSIVSASFRGKNRAIAFGVWGSVMSAAAAVGPFLGGLFTQTIGWRWIFLVNAPLGLFVFIAAIPFVPKTGGKAGASAMGGAARAAAAAQSGAAEAKPQGFDPLGVVLSALGSALLIFGLIEGQTYDWFKPKSEFAIGGFKWGADWPVSVIPFCIVLGIIFFVLFVHTENSRARRLLPVMLDLTLFRIPTFSMGNIAAGAIQAGQFAIMFVLPLYLINVRGINMLPTGALIAVMGIGSIVSGGLARPVTAKIGAPHTVQFGLIVEILSVVLLMVMMRPSLSVAWLLVPFLLYGFGLGFAAAQLTSLVLSEVPIAESGEGSATQSTIRQLGTGIGAAVAGLMLSVMLGHVTPSALDGINGLNEGMVAGLTKSLDASAGAAIVGIRAQGTTGKLGALGPQVADALASAFTRASQWTLVVAIVMLGIGLLASVWVARAADRSNDE